MGKAHKSKLFKEMGFLVSGQLESRRVCFSFCFVLFCCGFKIRESIAIVGSWELMADREGAEAAEGDVIAKS